ncbi:MAG: hypothetical protein PHQ32_05215 [Firmicutes bacterium]|nr:hypothetical protein [Bacillota bacterium]
MKNKLIVLLSILLLLLSVISIVILVLKDSKQTVEVDIRYAVTSTTVEDNKAEIKVMAGVFSGKDVDPFSYVRLIDDYKLSYYPLNGFSKPSLNKGDSLEITFDFFNPDRVENVLEIKNSAGVITRIDITLPEIINKETTGIQIITENTVEPQITEK